VPKLTKEHAKEVLINRLDNLKDTISNVHDFAERYEIVYDVHTSLLDFTVCIDDIIGAIEEGCDSVKTNQ